MTDAHYTNDVRTADPITVYEKTDEQFEEFFHDVFENRTTSDSLSEGPYLPAEVTET